MDNVVLAGVHDLQSLKVTDPRILHEKLGAAVASKMVLRSRTPNPELRTLSP